ncbi:sigma-70 family RNA polymerase sigma factor [Streptomyces vilmorinianum]|uniref:sigma-70 family RNA polymerase sigma factor n=1 Tax=Streptomyces vilmorinianum TaxID=3051092 RepID=UPI0010FB8111|nr:sigma-70 family RNA polymerase sigma factor [Streptomyces vilmorinianum]
MHSDERGAAALVAAAAAGDTYAGERLLRAWLPLVYNIVGRALDGHADVDDVVQETMVRALAGLPGLRDPERFRSWLIAIAMNQIRRRWRERQSGPLPGLDRAAELADPGGDFADLTILRLGLSGQRRELAEATRWLDEGDRDLLALWWLEAGGELSRAELAEALHITPAHAAVRVQRMKDRLETGRAVVRALAAKPPCAELALVTADWDGHPAPLWRKRLARHVTTCSACDRARSDLAPAEGLLVGLGLVPPLLTWALDDVRPETEPAAWDTPYADTPYGDTPYGDTPGPEGEPVPDAGVATGPYGAAGVTPEPVGVRIPGPRRRRASERRATARRACAAGVVALGVLGGLILLVPSQPEAGEPAPRTPAAPPPVPSTVRQQTAAPAPRPSRATSTAPTPTPTPDATPTPTAEERLTRLVNQRRAQAGCAPLRTDPKLATAARAYARDMVRRGYYAHSSPEGESADTRISAAGYAWSGWAENLARGTADPATVFAGWMDGAMHERNMLDCGYRHTGVAAVSGPDGTVWVQKLATPAS